MLFLIALALAIFVLPSPWGVVAVVCALAIDLVEVGVGLWYSKRRRSSVGSQTLVGLTGVAIGDLQPDGQVRVDGEIWRARCAAGCEAGSTVVVRAVDGLTLEVEPA
ncbi:MAG TPA: NfeD family protein [Gaiellaceae bacterium]|nr:NfeD family protein [Gaiellaceae bacterium]